MLIFLYLILEGIMIFFKIVNVMLILIVIVEIMLKIGIESLNSLSLRSITHLLQLRNKEKVLINRLKIK